MQKPRRWSRLEQHLLPIGLLGLVLSCASQRPAATPLSQDAPGGGDGTSSVAAASTGAALAAAQSDVGAETARDEGDRAKNDPAASSAAHGTLAGTVSDLPKG